MNDNSSWLYHVVLFPVVQIAERAEHFRQQIGGLELLAATHNGTLRRLIPVNAPLMQTKLRVVVAAIEENLMVGILAPKV